MDGHTALDAQVIARAQSDGLETVLVRLTHGRDNSEVTIHIAPASVLNVSGRLLAEDVLTHLRLPVSTCNFTTRQLCTWQPATYDTDVASFADTFSAAVRDLAQADDALRQALFIELPKSRPRRNERYLRHLGDGHRGQEVTRFTNAAAEDDLLRYRFTYLKLGERDAGWVTHLVPKGDIEHDTSATLRLLGFSRLDQCVEADFQACWWRSIRNPHAGQFVEDMFEEGQPAELAHRSYQAMPGNLPRLMAQVVRAHRGLATLGFRYLPTPERTNVPPPPRQRLLTAGSPYDAYAAVRSVIAGAGGWLGIADPYIDHSMAELLHAAPSHTRIQVLTRRIMGDGALALKKLAAQRGRIEVRIDPADFHDRFILTDSTAYQLGSSIKDAGLKTTMMSRIDTPTEEQKLRNRFATVWSASSSAI